MINTLALTFNGAYTVASYGQVVLGKFFGNKTADELQTVESVLNVILFVEIAAFFFSIFSVNLLRRKILIIIYGTLIGVMNIALGVVGTQKSSLGVKLVLSLIVFIQNVFGIPVLILYAIEISSNTALALNTLYQ